MTPSEELFLSVLVGRIRLGEKYWTFHRKFTRVAKSLEEQGFVTWKSGMVENSIIVWPTPTLLNHPEYHSRTYEPPRETALKRAAEDVLAECTTNQRERPAFVTLDRLVKDPG